MKKEISFKNKRSSSQNPKIKISINSNFIENDNNIESNKYYVNLNDDEPKIKRKKVRFLTNETHKNTDFQIDNLSPPKTLKNSILKKSSSRNSKIDEFFKKLTQRHAFNIHYNKNTNKKHKSSSIKSNINHYEINNNNASDVKKDNKPIIFY